LAFGRIAYTSEMGDALFELLLVLAELLLEVLFEFAGEAILDLLLRAIAEVFETSDRSNPVVASVGYVFLGSMAGVLSLLVFPHPIVRPSKVHGISLLVSPIVTGLLMSFIGSTLRRQGKRVVQIESFGYGFAFALGMAVIRYFFVV
jgi:hypothetical protein